MEYALGYYSNQLITSSARFGNVAFSQGSLLHSCENRIYHNQPLVAPKDVKRYFLTEEEASRLSILATFNSKSGELFVPNIKKSSAQSDFPSIIRKLLRQKGYKMLEVKSENTARKLAKNIKNKKEWPCLLFHSDTTGEKNEEFFLSSRDKIKNKKFKEIEIVDISNLRKINRIKTIRNKLNMLKKKSWTEKHIIKLVKEIIENFNHIYKGKSLEEKM